MIRAMHRLSIAAILGMLAALASPAAVAQTFRFDLPAQPLKVSLRAVGQLTHVNILFDSELVEGLMAPSISAELTTQEAVRRLTADKNLNVQQPAPDTITVSKRAANSTPASSMGAADGASAAGTNLRLAQADEPVAGGQGTDRDAATDTKGIAEILVKGVKTLNTDIKRSRDDAQPYTVFTQEDIQRSGAATIEDFLLNNLPSMDAMQPSSQLGLSQLGSRSAVSLRGLGTAQTLILIDGRRAAAVNNEGNTEQPDLNGIPVSAIERIEVLATTAAGIYGGGATGGVINIVLKRDYRGVEVSFTREDTVDGGGAGNRVDLNGGFDMGSGKTNLVFSASFSNRDELLAQDRDLIQRAQAYILEVNRANFFGNNATPPLGLTTNIRSNDPAVNGVRPSLTFKQAYGGGSVGSPYTWVPVGYGGPSTDNGAGLIANAGTFNFQLANTAQSVGGGKRSLFNAPTIKSFSSTLRHDVSERTQVFLELGASSNSGEFISNPLSGSFTVPANAASNPFNQSVRVTTPMLGADTLADSQSRTKRAVGGVIVRLPKDWQFSADYTWNRTRTSSSLPSTFVRFDTGSAINSGAVNIFRDTNAFPVDFSGFMLSPMTSGPADLTLADAVVRAGGPVPIALPGGKIMLSSFLERSHESLDENTSVFPFPDPVLGESLSLTTRYGRNRTVESGYAELRLPFISPHNRIPGLRLLEVQLAGRWDHYNLESSNITNDAAPEPFVRTRNSLSSVDPVVAVRLQPVPDITLRASFGTGFNPPDLNSLTPSVPFIYTPGDPTLSSLTDPLRNEPLGATGNNVEYLFGGNPNLQPEESKSESIGAIFTPRFLPGFRASLDWTKIRKTNNISALSFEQQYLLLENLIPGLIVRSAPLGDGLPGPIVQFDGRVLNFSRQDVQALDAAAEYRWDTLSFGEFVVSSVATRNLHNQTRFTPLSDLREDAGVGSIAKLRATASLAWSLRQWSASWKARYLSAYWLDAAHTLVPNQGAARISSQIYHDAEVRYAWGQMTGAMAVFSQSELQLGVRNIFNRRPNIDLSLSTSTPYTASGDPRLATYWLTLKKSFHR